MNPNLIGYRFHDWCIRQQQVIIQDQIEWTQEIRIDLKNRRKRNCFGVLFIQTKETRPDGNGLQDLLG